MRDWVAWHELYDDPSSVLSARLRLVQAQLSDALDRAPAGPVRLLSLCAGQGRDVIGVLPAHPRRDDVRGVLIEADPENAETARREAATAGLPQVEVRQADASRPGGYADALPAHVLLLCGIFGNVSDADIQRTIVAAPALTAPGGSVIWTRHRRPPDLTPQVRAWFREAGFAEVSFSSPENAPRTAVGAGRLRRAAASGTNGSGTPGGPDGPGGAETAAAWPGEPLFTFRSRA
ncbi:MAG: class I SAM-dependent methyltransferase [Streptosporangiaceae bacterium]